MSFLAISQVLCLAAAAAVGDIDVVLAADDACRAESVAGEQVQCASELAQLRASALRSQSVIATDHLGEEAAELAARIHSGVTAAAAATARPAGVSALQQASAEHGGFAASLEAKPRMEPRPDSNVHVDERRLCLPERVLNFSAAVVSHSNLGGMGPDDGAETLVFQGIGVYGGFAVDLTVTASSSYLPNDALKNGIHGGQFGLVNLKVNHDVDLTFRFADGNGEPVIMDPFFLTFYDIDQGMSHGSRESVTVHGFEAYKLAQGSELDVIDLGEGAATFQSSLRGGKVDNPTHPRSLTAAEEDRTVVLTMPAASEFRVTLSESSYADEEQGRNFLFSGPSSMVCGNEHRCIDYHCPVGYQIRTMAEFLVCGDHHCESQDRDTCCFEIPDNMEGIASA